MRWQERRQRTLTFTSEAEAEAVEAQAKTRVAVAEQTYVDPSKVTMTEYLDAWLSGRAKIRATTRVNYRGHMAHAKKHLGSRRVQTLTRTDVASFVAALTCEGLAPSTVRAILVVLHKALRDAIPDLRQTDPTYNVEVPEFIARERPTWSAKQVRVFLALVDDDPLVGAWHLTMRGLRRGEVVRLRWSDVDMEKKVLRIRETRVQAGTEIVTGPPKTTRGRRDIPSDTELLRALRLTPRTHRHGSGSRALAPAWRGVREPPRCRGRHRGAPPPRGPQGHVREAREVGRAPDDSPARCQAHGPDFASGAGRPGARGRTVRGARSERDAEDVRARC